MSNENEVKTEAAEYDVIDEVIVFQGDEDIGTFMLLKITPPASEGIGSFLTIDLDDGRLDDLDQEADHEEEEEEEEEEEKN